MKALLLVAALLTLAPGLAAPARAASAPATSCIACHSNSAYVGKAQILMVQHFSEGVHAAAGLSCQDCHGGNPDPALSDDIVKAMDPRFKANPFVGAPRRQDIPKFCGRCHADPNYMKRFVPDARVDQLREYWTSQHGKALAKGDTRVATCVDCHGVHRILAPSDPASPVYPTHVAETCSRCHSDAKRMAGYRLPDGRPLPIDQYARWRQSVHAHALLDKEDLSAPTCNDCHGNHGATPPGLESIAFVCGQCHGREADLFRASAKLRGFQAHDQYLASAGSKGCAACHAPPEPQAKVKNLHAFSECTVCHGSHGIVRPTIAMLSPLPKVPCAFCHESGIPIGSAVKEIPAVQKHFEEVRDGLLAGAKALGLSGEERFDWLVDRALQLPFHTLPGKSAEAGGRRRLRPEFQRLFLKFRIGKTYYTYRDPKTGKTARAEVVRCARCHGPKPVLGQPVGYETARSFLDHMVELTARTARAERILLAARRGGVSVQKPTNEIDQAVDSQIELEVLVHTFSAAPGGKFLKKFDEGRGHADTALAGTERAFRELALRRRGLAVSLVLILFVLVGLALKIRQLSGRHERSDEPPGGAS